MLQDADYESSGGKIVDNKDAFGQDIVLKVRPPKLDQEVGHFKDGSRCASCRISHLKAQHIMFTATATIAFNGQKFLCTACRLISYIHPARSKELLDELQKKHMTVLGKLLYQAQ